MEHPKEILIVLFGAIGDVTRALPTVSRLKQAWPECRISWAIEPKSLSVLESTSLVDEILLFDRPRGFPAYIRFIRELRSHSFDLTIDFQRHFKSGVTSWLSRAPRRIGFHQKNAKEFNWLFNSETIPRVDNFSSKFEHYQFFADALGIARPERADFSIATQDAVQQRLRRLLEDSLSDERLARERAGYLGLILGSSWESRFWEPEYYQQVARQLWEERRLLPVLLGSAGERAIAEQIQSGLGAVPHVSLIERTSLSDLFQLFPLFEVALGPDSGPMHIAAAAGCPVVSLWGATSPLRSAPIGNEHLVVQSPIGCSPCYRRECPGLDRLCMKQLTPKTVRVFVEKALSEEPERRRV